MIRLAITDPICVLSVPLCFTRDPRQQRQLPFLQHSPSFLLDALACRTTTHRTIMRLELLPAVSKAAHKELASAVSWNITNDLYSCSDDQSIQRWSPRGELQGKVCVLDTYFSDLHCYPLGSKKQQSSGTDVIAVACTDGTLKLVGSNGRLEKNVDAHRGAVLSVRWSPDGSAIATSGEDGHVKVWSRAGMLRSTLVQAEEPVYCVAWGGSDASQLLFCSGCYATTKSLQGAGGPGVGKASSSPASWKAHDGLVLKADWNTTNHLIVTGGEDCRYKVWDAFGRLLYQSSLWEHSVTSVAWNPDGTLFAAGSFNCLALCDRQGWSYCQVRPSSGSLLGLCWSPDGTCLAACGGNGSVALAALLDVRVEDGRVVAVLESERVISVADMLAEMRERLEFRDPVVKMSLGCGHLVVCTATQCHIFSATNWNTPHIFDLKEPAQLLLQCGRGFALLDASSGIEVFTYEGRQVCALKPQGLPGSLSQQLISLSNDTLALASGSSVRCFETAQGRPVGEAINHSLEIKAVCLSQFGTATDRLLALLDANGDLYLLKPLAQGSSTTGPKAAAGAAPGAAASSQYQQQQQQQRLVKLASNVSGPPVWHDSAPMLAAMVDGQLLVWYHPAAAFVDKGLLEVTKSVQSEGAIGAGATLDMFSGGSLLLRRRDGARVYASIAPQPVLLHELVRQGQWDKAVRLARFSYDNAIWACLAALAMAAGELATAEAAYAATDSVDKLHFVLHLRSLAGAAGGGGAGAAGDVVVAAELAMYRRQQDEAEAMLLQAGLLYRAIKLHVRLHNWQRALDLARKHEQHIDTVLMCRRRHLRTVGQQEVLPSFLAMAQEVVDEAAVKEHIKQDKAKEVQLRAAAAGRPALHAGSAVGVAAQNRPRR